MPAFAAENPYSLALKFVQQYRVDIAAIPVADQQVAGRTLWQIAKNHEAAAIQFRDNQLFPRFQDAVIVFFTVIEVDPGALDYRLLDLERKGISMAGSEMRPMRESFNLALASIIAAWFIRWQNRFHSYLEFALPALEEVLEYELHEAPNRQRQQEWFTRARDWYFQNSPDELPRAQASGWYEWAASDECVSGYLDNAYNKSNPFEWMLKQLQDLSSIGWVKKGSNDYDQIA